jgi:hypothetical protein
MFKYSITTCMLNSKLKQLILGTVVGVICVYLLSVLVVENKLQSTQLYLDNQLQSQTNDLRELAILSARGGVSVSVEKFIPECESTDRVTFDTLLASLDRGLSNSELQKLSSLFDKCGRVFASRRAAMVLEFDREVNNFEELLTLKSMLGDDKDTQPSLVEWKNLVEKEKSISDKFLALVNIQEQIIKTLLAGDLTTSSKVEAIRKQADIIMTELTVVTKEASAIRTTLTTP